MDLLDTERWKNLVQSLRTEPNLYIIFIFLLMHFKLYPREENLNFIFYFYSQH